MDGLCSSSGVDPVGSVHLLLRGRYSCRCGLLGLKQMPTSIRRGPPRSRCPCEWGVRLHRETDGLLRENGGASLANIDPVHLLNETPLSMGAWSWRCWLAGITSIFIVNPVGPLLLGRGQTGIIGMLLLLLACPMGSSRSPPVCALCWALGSRRGSGVHATSGASNLLNTAKRA